MNNSMDDKLKVFSTIIGFLLLAAGVYVFYFLLNELFKVFIDFESSAFISTIVQLLNGKELITTHNGKQIIFGEGAALILAFLFLTILASGVGRIGYLLFKSGFSLLSSNIADEMKRIKEDIKRIKEDIKILIDKLPRIEITNKQ